MRKPNARFTPVLVTLKLISIQIFLGFLTIYSAPLLSQEESNRPQIHFLHSDWPPFEYASPDGETTGYTVEIVKAMQKLVDVDSTIELHNWNRAYQTALKHPNYAVFTMARTNQREPLFYWVGPIAEREIYLWKLKSRKDIQVKTLEDVKEYRVGTVRGEAGEQQLLSKGFKYDVNIHSVENQTRNFLLLFNDRIDFFYGLELTTIFILRKEGYDPYEVEKTVLLSGGQGYYIGFNRETPFHIVQQFSDALQTIKHNGTFARIQRKYGIATP